MFFNLFFIFVINLFKFKFFLIDIKTWSYFLNLLFNLPFIKSDLVKGKLNNKFKKYDHILLSIKKDFNLNKLILKIKNKLKNKFISNEDILITRERHRVNLENCVEYLKRFQERSVLNDIDKAAEDLRLATRHLGMIVGKVDVEEILGSIFSDFCIGK